jgi:hypothetical protein
MATLGLTLIWTGYALGIFGWSRIKHSSLTFSDIALPSHRSTYVTAAQGWAPATPAVLGPGSIAYLQGQAASTGGPNPGQTGPQGGGTSARGSYNG